MGSSASAHILFGVLIGGEDYSGEELPFEPNDFEDWVIEKFSGLVKPTEEYPNDNYGRITLAAEQKAIQQKYSDYWDATRKWFSTNCPLEVENTGYMDGYSDYWLVLKNNDRVAGDYGFEEITKLPEQNTAAFQEACAKFGIVGLPDPKLFLCAKYG